MRQTSGATTCETTDELSATAAGTLSAIDERGNTYVLTVPVTASAAEAIIPGGTWTTPSKNMKRFIGVNRLITSVLPLLIYVSYLTVVGFGSMRLATGGLDKMIVLEIIGLIVMLVGVRLAEPMFDAIETAAEANDGRYGVTAQFQGVSDILLGVFPILVVLSLFTIVAVSGFSNVRKFKREGGIGGMRKSMG